MKVYVPSHKRPDSKLFEITSGLNIILQFEEDAEPYAKWKGRHNVIYIPELRGLLDARNWILKNNNNWVLMMDDDILEFTDNSEVIEWDNFLEKAENAVLRMDRLRIGIAGLNLTFDEQMSGADMGLYTVNTSLRIFQAVFLNCGLLNLAGYKYEGCPYDGFNGQKAYGEDINILIYCYKNNIPMAKFNSLGFNIDDKQPTVCWENDKNIWSLLSKFWLLDKYKEDEILAKSMLYYIKKSLERCKYEYGEELYNKIMEKISYEILNKGEGDTEMRKFLIGGLVLSLLLGLNGCPTDGGNTETAKKVVEAKYRGTFKSDDGIMTLLTNESEMTFTDTSSSSYMISGKGETYPAWTAKDGNFIYLYYQHPDGSSPSTQGYFKDENIFILNGGQYEFKRQ